MVTDRDGGVDIDRDRDGHRQGWRCRHRQRQTEMVTDRDGGVDIDRDRQRWSQTGMEV